MDVILLNELLLADFDNGILYWKSRDINHFKTIRDCNAWNTRYANKEALNYYKTGNYKFGSIYDKRVYAHKVIYQMYFQTDIDGVVDHINGIKTDNRIINLRMVSHKENAKNLARRANKSVLGVGITKGRRGTGFLIQIGYGENKYRKEFKNHIDALKHSIEKYKEFGYSERHYSDNLKLIEYHESITVVNLKNEENSD